MLRSVQYTHARSVIHQIIIQVVKSGRIKRSTRARRKPQRSPGQYTQPPEHRKVIRSVGELITMVHWILIVNIDI